MRKKFVPDDGEMNALRWFYDQHGRNWKFVLSKHWENGTNPSTNADYNSDLRALRNRAGVVWLKKFTFPKR